MSDRFDEMAHSLFSNTRLLIEYMDAKTIAAALRTVAEETAQAVRQRCAEVARGHKPPPPKKAYLLTSDEVRASIDDEARGEKIAAEMIAATILALDLTDQMGRAAE